MSEQIDPRPAEEREASESGLLLSSEPLRGGANFSSVLGDYTKSDSDASDTDGSDLLGGGDSSDTDGNDATDASDTDGTDRAADTDASDDFDVIGIDAPAGARDETDSSNLVGGDSDASDASDADSSDRR